LCQGDRRERRRVCRAAGFERAPYRFDGGSTHCCVAICFLAASPRRVIRYRSDPTRMSGFARSGHELIAKISRSAKKRHLHRAVGVRIEKTSVGPRYLHVIQRAASASSLRQLRTAHSYHGAFCATFRDPPFSEIAGLGGAGRVAERPEPTPAIFLSRRPVGAGAVLAGFTRIAASAAPRKTDYDRVDKILRRLQGHAAPPNGARPKPNELKGSASPSRCRTSVGAERDDGERTPGGILWNFQLKARSWALGLAA
jgi:hypothetical protein